MTKRNHSILFQRLAALALAAASLAGQSLTTGDLTGTLTDASGGVIPKIGVELVNGSHVDSLLGDKPVVDMLAQVLVKFSPGGDTAAVYTLSTGWINDMFVAGAGPTAPIDGLYGTPGGYVAPGGQEIILGPATGIVLPV